MKKNNDLNNDFWGIVLTIVMLVISSKPLFQDKSNMETWRYVFSLVASIIFFIMTLGYIIIGVINFLKK